MSLNPTVMKFGGTSVADASAFARVADLVRRHADERPVVVVSAMSRVTDALLESVGVAAEGRIEEAVASLEGHFARHIEVARALLRVEPVGQIEAAVGRERAGLMEAFASLAAGARPRPLLQDLVVSYGERLSATLLAAVLREAGLDARYIDARWCIITDEQHGRATPLKDETEASTRAHLEPLIEAGEVPVLGGFIASSVSGETTTLGRGGSDYTCATSPSASATRDVTMRPTPSSSSTPR
ncbi:MAG: hypothetical protein LC802_15185 [Acidobacteria bacterium]|nr:hypothetical protein [Acidobacteriota bacterium]